MIDKKFFDPFQDLTSLETVQKARCSIEQLEKQFAQGHGKSGYLLALLFTPDTIGIPNEVQRELGVSYDKATEYYERAYMCLLQEAQAGKAEAMYLLALYFQSGIPPAQYDEGQYEYWRNKAIRAGYRGVGQL